MRIRRLDLCLFISGVLAFSACGSDSTPAKDGGHDGSGTAGTTGTGGTTGGAGASGTTGTAGIDGGVDAPVDMAPTDGGMDGSTDGGLTTQQLRGQYLATSVLGCSGCHTPQKVGGGGPDTTKLFSGVDCFTKDTAGTGCLGSANLTNDATGIKNLTDQQVIDAFTKGVFPDKLDGGAQYLFANMPYYQFSTISTADASAIVAYFRSLTPVAHAAAANTGGFATRPTAAQWAFVTLAELPVPTAADAGATDPSNGKYLAAMVCATCHTVNTAAVAPAPLQLDATKAFQGGKTFTTTVSVPVDAGTDAGDAGADAGTMSIMKQIQSVNLTPDTTGIKTWTAQQIVTAIKAGKDEGGRTICSPMRSLPGLTDKDAFDIASYLQAIPPKVNAIALTCE